MCVCVCRVGGLAFAPRLHGALAAYITRCLGWAGLGVAMPHYAKSSDTPEFIAAVAAAASHAGAREEELFVCRAALTTAAARQYPGQPTALERAQTIAQDYEKTAGHPVLHAPLLNFTGMFLEVSDCSRGA